MDFFFFFSFVNVSNFDWKFHAFKIKSLCQIFINFGNPSWIMACRTYISDQTPFKAFFIMSILNINQGFSWIA